MNYQQLYAAIQNYAESTEQLFVESIPTFVQQCEERVYNAVQIPAIRKNVIGNFTQDDSYLALPNDYLASFSLAVIDASGNYEYLIDKDVNFIRQSYPNPTTDTGTPRYYAQFQPYTYLIGPTPDANYQTELHYYYYPESIVTAGTTWLGDNFDSVLFYGALQEGYTFIKAEPDMLGRIDAQYKEALSLAKRLGDGLERQDAYRSGQVRYPVR